MDADEVIALLRLAPHPEGGYYAETWRDVAADGGRGAGSAIHFLLPEGVTSAWHRVDAAEVWHHYAGAAVELSIAEGEHAYADEAAVVTHVVGDELLAGERPQVVVPAGAWQRARSLGAWSLVGCTVSPAFTFQTFELAPAAPASGAPPDDAKGSSRK